MPSCTGSADVGAAGVAKQARGDGGSVETDNLRVTVATIPASKMPATQMDSRTAAFDRASAAHIAAAFLPARWFGRRFDYYYTLAKLRTDPLYPGVLDALRGCDAPLLDLGCGLGLLAHALRADGQAQSYLGVDIDAAKVARARRAAAQAGLVDVRYETADLGDAMPRHAGSVAILDVLQYLPVDRQQVMLADAARMLTPDARLVIRSGLDDGNGRGQASRVSDRLAHAIGWMQERPRQPPSREGLLSQLRAQGLQVAMRPLYGNTPFNNWLIVATR
jgi:SAM-dependent methyltransferase